jgi:signal transduction histidine kinase
VPSFGLRPRLLAALVLTSVVTLGFAAVALLSPLKQRLRNDATATVLAAVTAARPAFEDGALTDHGKLDTRELQHEALTLDRKVGGRVLVFDPQGHPIADTDPSQPVGDTPDVSRTLAGSTIATHEIVDNVLLVSQPLRIGGKRYALAVRRRLVYVPSATRVVTNAFLKAAGVGLAVALIIGIGLATTLLRRLERLRDATRELDERGIGAAPPVDASRDEIGELTRAFASMQTRLRRQEDARRAFVATASHELRTPLASLDGMLELIADDLDGDPVDLEDARERLARAQEQTHRLANLASDLLDLSRLDAAIDLRSEPIELIEVARAVAAEFELRAQRYRVTIEIVPATESSWGLGDPGSVARIVRIMLDNALRVAPPDSAVTIIVREVEGRAAVEVHDVGPGIPAQDRERIFERFQRGSGRAGEGGFGLGLAIGRELAARMEGDLVLADTVPPDGATFRLTLPQALVRVHV